MRFLLLAATAASLVAGSAAAQSVEGPRFSANVGYSHFVDGSNDEVGAVTGRFGARFTPYIGAEVEGGVGATTPDVSGFDFKINNYVAGYVVGYLPMSDKLELIGRLGYATTDFEVGGAELTDGGFSGGLGAQYFFDASNGVRADITNHQFEDLDATWDAFSIAYVRRF